MARVYLRKRGCSQNTYNMQYSVKMLQRKKKECRGHSEPGMCSNAPLFFSYFLAAIFFFSFTHKDFCGCGQDENDRKLVAIKDKHIY
ncbi:unnamed protein product [Ixodes pacificus]